MTKLITAAAAALVLVSGSAMAGDAAKGEGLYAAKGCVGCHGPNGKSMNEATYPSLAGKDEAFVVEQIKAFKAGTRSNPMMSPMAATITEAEAADIGAYVATK
ncbi:MAG: c-type cytochrome [Gammaproteobacteria bacterium]